MGEQHDGCTHECGAHGDACDDAVCALVLLDELRLSRESCAAVRERGQLVQELRTDDRLDETLADLAAEGHRSPSRRSWRRAALMASARSYFPPQPACPAISRWNRRCRY